MSREMKLAYGEKDISFSISEKASNGVNYKILETSYKKKDIDWNDKIENVFSNPTESPTLTDMVLSKNVEDVVIIINDVTRPVPYEIVLRPMLKELKKNGVKTEQITLLIATGMHRPMTADEVKKNLGCDIADRYKWVNHRCDDEMLYLGNLKENIPFYLNPLAVEADLLCAVGVIAPHYMAGFSGGRKSVLPGVCGRKTIEDHHALMRLPDSKTANLKNNKFHETMMEAAETAGLDFIANVVVDSKNEVINLTAGNFRQAWEKGVEYCQKASVIELNEPGDAAIVSVGGFPKDINMYQAQKALENASYCVKEGGPILLLAECREGFGEETFARWLAEAENPAALEKRISRHFELGGHKAFAVGRVAQKHPLYLYSELSRKESELLFMEKVNDIRKFTSGFISGEIIYILPHGANTVPTIV